MSMTRDLRTLRQCEEAHAQRQRENLVHDRAATVLLCADCADLEARDAMERLGRERSWWERPRAALVGLLVSLAVQAGLVAAEAGWAAAAMLFPFGLCAVVLGVMWERHG